jgi:hypothetical protein
MRIARKHVPTPKNFSLALGVIDPCGLQVKDHQAQGLIAIAAI